MPLAPGTLLGSYQIISPLGAGGMGEVYRATDTRLDRTVAIKILPAAIAADPSARQRFEREAKTISSLNHPHVCTLFDVGQHDGLDFLVMECLEGESLAARLEKGPLPIAQVLKLGAQIASALDKAHRSGIVHRDLKPGNIMLTASGAKLLDFGLAKESSPIAHLATVTANLPRSPITQEGSIVGTFQYMSPEQVEGQELDGRSDIFSLGAVLYESVTGKRAFPGKTQLSVASAILELDPPPILTVLPLTPPALDHAIRRCLIKNRDDRWQSARDLASELEWIASSGSQSSASALHPHAASPLRSLLPWLLSALLAALLLAAIFFPFKDRTAAQARYFYGPIPFSVQAMAVAPNGHTTVLVGKQQADRANQLWLYEPGAQRLTSIPNTEGASFPFWSFDGKSLGFFADAKLKKIDLAGGAVQAVCDAPSGRGGTWNKDGIIVFTPSGQLIDGLYRVPATGGTPVRVTLPDTSRGEDSHRWPLFLPDQKHFLYLAANVSGQLEPDAIFAGALDSKEKKFITKATGNAYYASPGYLVFYREKTLFAQPFDAARLELSGQAIPLVTDLAYLPRIMHVAFAVSDTSVLVAQSGAGLSASRLVWFDRKGTETGSVGATDLYSNFNLSPDGKTLALDKTDQDSTNSDVWTYDLQHNAMKRLTFDPAIDAMPIWNPDGSQILFTSSRFKTFALYIKPADGTQEEKRLPFNSSDEIDLYCSDWSRDGKYILYSRGSELWVGSLATLQARPFLTGSADIRLARFSPDGKWIAYSSNESGKFEIYVTSFPDAHGKWQVSNAGGTQPRWRGDTKELFYLSPDGKLTAVDIAAGSNFNAGVPITLFQAHPRELIATSEQVTYDVSRDGQRFLINTQLKNVDSQPLSVILNWDAALTKK